MKSHRLSRIAEAIREVASETILFELRDPRVKNVTVIRAEVSGDLQHAKVYVSIMGSESEQKLCMYGLRNAGNVKPGDEINIIKTKDPQMLRAIDALKGVMIYAQQSAPKAEAVKK